MVMEKLEHGSLYKYLQEDKNSCSWGWKLRVAMNIAEGMSFLHSFEPKILHQDLKSPNVLISAAEESERVVAKLADFGKKIFF